MPAIIRAFPVAAYARERRSGDRRDVALHDGRAGVLARAAPSAAAAWTRRRTFLEKAVAFPQNINVEVTVTYTTTPDTGAADAGGGGAGAAAAAAAARGPSATILVHHSMVKLPEKPMMPRLFDERVGYFTQGLTDYGTGEQQQMQKRFITRYRLEKKDPNAAISEPVKPIIYYVDPATPKKWVPCIKTAIESWQPAFEVAGFKNGHRREGSAEQGRAIRTGAPRTSATRSSTICRRRRRTRSARTCTIRAAARSSKRTCSITTTS